MNAMQQLNAPFVTEALAYLDRYELPPEAFQNVRASLAHNACKEEIAPYIRQIVRIKSLCIPGWILHKDGRMESNGDGMTDAMREVVEQLQARIGEITARYERMFEATPAATPAPCPGSPDTAESRPQSKAQ